MIAHHIFFFFLEFISTILIFLSQYFQLIIIIQYTILRKIILKSKIITFYNFNPKMFKTPNFEFINL